MNSIIKKKFFSVDMCEDWIFSLGIGDNITLNASVDRKNWGIGGRLKATTDHMAGPHWRDYVFAVSLFVIHFSIVYERCLGEQEV